jgi:hypothetical protein
LLGEAKGSPGSDGASPYHAGGLIQAKRNSH